MATLSSLNWEVGSEVLITLHFNTYVYVTHIVHMPRKEFNNNNLKSRGREKSVAAEGTACTTLWRQS